MVRHTLTNFALQDFQKFRNPSNFPIRPRSEC